MVYKKWTLEDKEFIKNNVTSMSDDEIALRLSQLSNTSVSVSMVRTQRRKLGIKKKAGRQAKNRNASSLVSTNLAEDVA